MTSIKMSLFSFAVCLAVLSGYTQAKKPLTAEDCEVCVKVMDKFADTQPQELRSKPAKDVETAITKFCKNLKGKEERFCYYIGAVDTSATAMLKLISEPYKSYFPSLRICEKVKEKIPHICELKYEKKIDLGEISFKKLKVKDLKKILADWDEEKACKGCSEKSDFVRAVKELLPKHAPEAAKKLRERDEL